MFFNKKKKILNNLISILKDYLNDEDIRNSIDLLENREYYLSFNTMITQIYEYDVEIDSNTYDSIVQVHNKLNFEDRELIVKLRELVRSDNDIPKTVKEGIGDILGIVKENNK